MRSFDCIIGAVSFVPIYNFFFFFFFISNSQYQFFSINNCLFRRALSDFYLFIYGHKSFDIKCIYSIKLDISSWSFREKYLSFFSPEIQVIRIWTESRVNALSFRNIYIYICREISVDVSMQAFNNRPFYRTIPRNCLHHYLWHDRGKSADVLSDTQTLLCLSIQTTNPQQSRRW